jgi:hypothetical protein
MDRPGHETASMFIGTEVEHSPAFGMKTLFVVGLQDPITVLATAQRNMVQHIYFGANQSFPNPAINDADTWRAWENMIKGALDSGIWCTLDLDVRAAEGLHESFLGEYDRFIPMISVKLPYIGLFNYNTTIKIDDKDFEATNPGVWCHSLHDLKNRSVFTDWSKYSQDEVIK